MKRVSLERARTYLAGISTKWYHKIEIAHGVFTKCLHVSDSDTPESSQWIGTWKAVEDQMRLMEWQGKRVLDVGCRDGKFSFLAEELGATVTGIDNDLSDGAVSLAALLNSTTKFEKKNVYELRCKSEYETILLCGVLYHLRFPMLALKLLSDALVRSGEMLIETALLKDGNEIPLLYCPVEDSPYEHTSCSFFNTKGLVDTMRSFGMEPVSTEETGYLVEGNANVVRAICIFRKTGDPILADYWYETHVRHTNITGDPAKI